MTNTTYYNLNIAEGTDIVNPLTVDNPNYEKIDETMHNNAVAGVTLATEITNATVHAITRENPDCAVIRFIATSQWKAGDTATVDGVPVTALLPSGETLPDGAYVINANVLCILTGTNLTIYAERKKADNANEITYNNTTVGAELTRLDGEIVRLDGEIDNINLQTNQIFHIGTIPAGQSATRNIELSDDYKNYKSLAFISYNGNDYAFYPLVPTSVIDQFASSSTNLFLAQSSHGISLGLANATSNSIRILNTAEIVGYIKIYGVK